MHNFKLTTLLRYAFHLCIFIVLLGKYLLSIYYVPGQGIQRWIRWNQCWRSSWSKGQDKQVSSYPTCKGLPYKYVQGTKEGEEERPILSGQFWRHQRLSLLSFQGVDGLQTQEDQFGRCCHSPAKEMRGPEPRPWGRIEMINLSLETWELGACGGVH